MLDRFLNHIKSKNFFENKKNLLLAISGGVDSMVLLHMMQQTDNQIAVAHIDHNTRNKESAKDAQFVENYCTINSIPFFLAQFNYDPESEGNFHQQSHIFRYKYLHSLGYDWILTAHHRDDHVETILLNFLNGKSTLGIAEKKNKVIRPLHSFSKDEIVEYAKNANIEYVHDVSNDTNNYDRNFLRNEVLTILKTRMPHISEKLINISQRHKSDDELLKKLISSRVPLENKEGRININKSYLIKDSTFIYHLIKPYGFNRSQSLDIIESLDNVGAEFISEDYVLLVDRETIIIEKNSEKKSSQYVINLDTLPQNIEYNNYRINFTTTQTAILTSDKLTAYFPIDKLKSKITIRSWKTGDSFYPLGMNNKSKSLKKYFVDQKIDKLSKIKIPIFLSGDDIIWIGGLRTDERYKCEKPNGQFLQITLTPLFT